MLYYGIWNYFLCMGIKKRRDTPTDSCYVINLIVEPNISVMCKKLMQRYFSLFATFKAFNSSCLFVTSNSFSLNCTYNNKLYKNYYCAITPKRSNLHHISTWYKFNFTKYINTHSFALLWWIWLYFDIIPLYQTLLVIPPVACLQ